MTRSEQLYRRAREVMPSGIHARAQAWNAADGTPRFITKGMGSHILDADGLEYIDYVGGFGAMIAGHSHPDVLAAMARTMTSGLSFAAPVSLEVEMAEVLVSLVPHIEAVRLVPSGAEAVCGAVRLARRVTGRDKLICFEGNGDSGTDCLPRQDKVGVSEGADRTPHAAYDTLHAPYNDADAVAGLFERNPGQIAAVLVEPVAVSMGVVPPAAGFLPALRRLCDRHGALLIFDERITGFRLSLGGAQQRYGVRADLVIFGSVLGGGLPIGAYAGTRALLEHTDWCSMVDEADGGNPVVLAAGLAQLKILYDNPSFYEVIDTSTAQLAARLRQSAQAHGIALTVNQESSLLCAYFTDCAVTNLVQAHTGNRACYTKYFYEMLRRGIWLAPSPFAPMFVGGAHTTNDLAFTAQAADEVFALMAQEDGA